MLQPHIKKSPVSTVVLALGLSMTTLCNADQVINDDLIVQGIVNGTGAMCVGLDCVNNETFGADMLRLKENNLRIRLHDSTTSNDLGASWDIVANDSTNGGASYLAIEYWSPIPGTVQLSSGSYPLFNCAALDQANPLLPIGFIPVDDPELYPVYNADSGLYECVDVPEYARAAAIKFGTAVAGSNGVALGYDSDIVQDAVSVGKADLARQLKHVAEGLADTDLLITKTLNNYSAYAAQRAQITTVMQQLDDIDAQLDDIETAVTTAEEDLPPSTPTLISPADGATGLNPDSVTLTWKRATDPDGDSLSYQVSYCEQADFSGCGPIGVAASNTTALFVALGGGTGMAMLGMIVPGGRRRQAGKSLLAMSVALTFLTACNGGSSGSGDNMSTTISALNAATLYYWKVEVSDGLKTTESDVRSFTTR